ncbi:hypothetical protein Lepto7376_4334 [[Leptolyngbya] sp. PCC 7376]|uniref:hypothetical protein n=1 Tax=[Leptolyngbya] sp. PCC 7376 TaxID=111781 RepID=UPI00029ECD25|nr:hypothetical protein [[Leptolyngbya] sp. PCC 7376]AFY40442.1 hypothetical protein Lepto7376_4334 [[Leptolyngbya] sp. PCC 7376]
MSENVSDLNKIIELPIDSLRSFDVVEKQFSDLGVLFANTVVLQPSNSLYLPEVGKMVLMGAPQNGWIEVTFTIPVLYFACSLTSSQHATIRAFDDVGEALCVFETEKCDHENSDPLVSSPPPNLPISLQAQNIQKVLLSSLDGQLVIHNVMFGF